MATPRQHDLFADEADAAPPPAATSALLKVPGATAKLSKAQKDFNRTSARVAQLREHVATWQAAAEALGRRSLQELVPLQQALLALQRDTVLWIDAFLQQPPAGEKLTKRGREKLVAMLRLLSRAVLEAGPDAQVEAAHDRYSPVRHQDHQRDETDMAAAIMGQVLGDDTLFEGEAGSIDELLERAADRLRQQQETAAEQPPDRRAARDAQALQEASQSVREVYRRLASTLHPDRETDAAERQRKSALMARANQAYEARDLLTLLGLQLETEQIDANHLAGLGDERLRHYNRVLKEQQLSLEDELAMLQLPAAQVLNTSPGLLDWGPGLLDLAHQRHLQDLQEVLQGLGHDAQMLREARTRPAFLRQLKIDDPDHGLSPMEAMMIEAALAEMTAARARPRRSPRKRR